MTLERCFLADDPALHRNHLPPESKPSPRQNHAPLKHSPRQNTPPESNHSPWYQGCPGASGTPAASHPASAMRSSRDIAFPNPPSWRTVFLE